jgi:hypothetical protein
MITGFGNRVFNHVILLILSVLQRPHVVEEVLLRVAGVGAEMGLDEIF